jgi:hypothetical protein
MTEGSYPAARAVAPRVRAHFARHLDGSRGRVPGAPASVPDVDSIAALIDAAFWASLRREEDYVPKISFALVAPDQVDRPLLFEHPLPLAPAVLTRLAPAVERPGIHLGVSRQGGDLLVWGATRSLPAFCCVLEVVLPGLLVIKHSREDESGKFVNVAVLEGDEVKVVDDQASTLPDCPAFLTSLLGHDLPEASGASLNVLVQLAASMRAHGRGGALLVVPSGTESWRESIARPIPYSVSPPFAALADLLRTTPGDRPHLWHESLGEMVEGIAGVTAVDGATVITDRFELLAFGAKVTRREGWPPIEQVTVTEPVEGVAESIVHPAELGNTRHYAGAQFAHDQRDAVALVASQDGRFTVFVWSPCEARVHAHRVETLLL